MASFRAVLAFTAVLAIALAPAAQARPMPALYFLKDAEVSPGHRAPIGDGVLSTVPPHPLDLNNPANNTASTRAILPESAIPTQFVANASANTGRIWGVIPVYLFLPETPALKSATLNVSLVALPKDPQVPPPVGGGGDVLAWARIPLDYNSTALPNATTMVPQNTTDPQAAAEYVANQLLVYGIVTVYSSGKLVYLDDSVKDYLVDRTVDPQARLALRLVLENGTAVSPLPDVPVPIGAGQDVVYDSGVAFSLASIPWYAPDPPVTTATQTQTMSPPSSSTTAGVPSSTQETTTKTKGSPALPAIAVGLAAVAAAWATRRRL